MRPLDLRNVRKWEKRYSLRFRRVLKAIIKRYRRDSL